jgi:hypothetical protein
MVWVTSWKRKTEQSAHVWIGLLATAPGFDYLPLFLAWMIFQLSWRGLFIASPGVDYLLLLLAWIIYCFSWRAPGAAGCFGMVK